MTQEVWTFTVIAALVIVPRLLLRWGIPAPLSAFGLGLLTLWIDYTFTGAHWSLLATLGITSLFLHAGMEVNVEEWLEEKTRLIWHIGLKMLVLLGVAGTVMYLYQIDLSLAVLIALAIVTPSTGSVKAAHTEPPTPRFQLWPAKNPGAHTTRSRHTSRKVGSNSHSSPT